jgi:hypothetical protein
MMAPLSVKMSGAQYRSSDIIVSASWRATPGAEGQMIAIVWQFDVKAGCEAEFEQFYGADGEWTAANRRSRSYLGSSFLRDQTQRSRYLVIEYWSEMLVYEQHKNYRSDEIVRLERRRNDLVSAVEPLGVFTALDVPDRAGPTWSRRM